MVDLSIVIVTFNSESFLRDCLTSISSQRTSFPFRVIVVDNASVDNSIALVEKKFPDVHIIYNRENKGFAVANNQGIRCSVGKAVLLLNSDTVLQANALESMFRFLKEHDDVGALGPKMLNSDGTIQRTGVTFPSIWNILVESLFFDSLFPHSKKFGRHRRVYEDPNQVYEVDYLQGSCLLVRRRALEDVGFFDEDYFMFFEETDLCLRMRMQGWKVMYVPEAAVTHFGGSGLGYYDGRRIVQYHLSFLLFIKKHYGDSRTLLLRASLIFRSLIRCILLVSAALLLIRRRRELLDRGKGYLRSLALILRGQR